MDPALEIEKRALALQKPMNDLIELGDSNVQQFYKDATVFITGGSGFIGKQLIEKLFRSCAIKKMYLLMKPKKNSTNEDRLKQILQDPVFDLVHQKKPHFANKIEIVEGDVTKTKMGINERQWSQIITEVQVIFHVAATTKFNAPLRVATMTNVCGTREALAIAEMCLDLRCFVYLSTAYAHATEARVGEEISEQFFPCPVPPDTLIQSMDNSDDEKLKTLIDNLIQRWPNTYSFTKAVAEELIRTKASNLPICIVRPPVVISAYYEPAPGWLDFSSVFGPSGIVVGTLIGALRVIIMDKSVKIALTPVDYVNNVTIVAPWDTTERRNNGDLNIPIYNVTNKHSLLTGDFIRKTFLKYKMDISSPKSIWYSDSILTKNKYLYGILSFFLHYIPAFIMDNVCDVLGKKPPNIKSFVKLYKKVDQIFQIYEHYLTNFWDFKNDNVTSMIKRMSEADRTIFNCNLASLDTTEYIKIWTIGIRKYIFKDGLKGTKDAGKRQYMYLAINNLLLLLIVYLLYKLFLFMTVVVS